MCQVHCPIKEESSLNEPSPPAKKQKTSTLANFIAKGNKQDEFLRDLVTAFAASNIPFEKLKKKEDGTTTLLRQFLDNGGYCLFVDPSLISPSRTGFFAFGS